MRARAVVLRAATIRTTVTASATTASAIGTTDPAGIADDPEIHAGPLDERGIHGRIARKGHHLPREFQPLTALALAVLCLVAMVYYNQLLALIFGGLMLVGFIYFRLTHDAEATAADGELVGAC